MRKFNLDLYFILSSFVLIGCDPIDDRLTIENNFKRNVIVSPNIYSIDSLKYSDFKHYVGEVDFYENEIPQFNEKKMLIKGSWDSYFKNDTLIILIFDEDEILKQGYSNSKEYKYLKKIKVSHKYLIDNNWRIVIDSNSNNKL